MVSSCGHPCFIPRGRATSQGQRATNHGQSTSQTIPKRTSKRVAPRHTRAEAVAFDGQSQVQARSGRRSSGRRVSRCLH